MLMCRRKPFDYIESKATLTNYNCVQKNISSGFHLFSIEYSAFIYSARSDPDIFEMQASYRI